MNETDLGQSVPPPHQAREHLTPLQINALSFALEDERKAYKTYGLILDRFPGQRPFVNIIEAENRHIEALLRLYQKFDLEVPVDRTQPDPSALTASLQDLCAIGVKSERDNVRLFDTVLIPAAGDNHEIVGVFTKLRDASAHRHLPAFERCLERRNCR
ncbi:DUF2202 domain-containing protein [Oceanicaulis sp. HTCC2633]|uniref:ferritin-like domain-containing protein n=1 Tax=Oceanicaulis sp. HTCC2633 TaxID=314254 RepID=UPI000324A970|nr:DUF2202 domain-containing protein [Oceanicaulis sp. HTCC2633]